MSSVGFSKRFLGRGDFVLGELDLPEHRPGHRPARRQRDRLIERLERARGMAALVRGESEVVPGFGIGRLERHGLFEQLGGRGALALVMKDAAEARPQVRPLRRALQRGLQRPDRIPCLAQPFASHRIEQEYVGVARPGGDQRRNLVRRVLRPARAEQRRCSLKRVEFGWCKRLERHRTWPSMAQHACAAEAESPATAALCFAMAVPSSAPAASRRTPPRLRRGAMATKPLSASSPQRHKAIPVRRIGRGDIRSSLRQGLDDFRAMRGDLIFVGLLYPLLGIAAAVMATNGPLMPFFVPIVAGVGLLGPVAAVGFYELARRREAGDIANWSHFLDVRKRPAADDIAMVVGLLVVFFGLWLLAAGAALRRLVRLDRRRTRWASSLRRCSRPRGAGR